MAWGMGGSTWLAGCTSCSCPLTTLTQPRCPRKLEPSSHPLPWNSSQFFPHSPCFIQSESVPSRVEVLATLAYHMLEMWLI